MVQSTPAHLEEADQRMEALQQKLLQRIAKKKPYEDLAEAIEQLKNDQQAATLAHAKEQYLLSRIRQMHDFLKGQTNELVEFDDSLVRQMVEHVMIYEDKIEVQFKSGVSVEVEE